MRSKGRRDGRPLPRGSAARRAAGPCRNGDCRRLLGTIPVRSRKTGIPPRRPLLSRKVGHDPKENSRDRDRSDSVGGDRAPRPARGGRGVGELDRGRRGVGERGGPESPSPLREQHHPPRQRDGVERNASPAVRLSSAARRDRGERLGEQHDRRERQRGSASAVRLPASARSSPAEPRDERHGREQQLGVAFGPMSPPSAPARMPPDGLGGERLQTVVTPTPPPVGSPAGGFPTQTP